jgi:hypothetical protein
MTCDWLWPPEAQRLRRHQQQIERTGDFTLEGERSGGKEGGVTMQWAIGDAKARSP